MKYIVIFASLKTDTMLDTHKSPRTNIMTVVRTAITIELTLTAIASPPKVSAWNCASLVLNSSLFFLELQWIV